MKQKLSQILFSQGFGTRRLCAGLVWNGEVSVHGEVVEEPDTEFETEGLRFTIHGREWPCVNKALILLNKPAGYECSQKPKHHPSVMSLLPAPLRERGVQPIGRLDEDTTGLLLLTDDGTLIHKLTSPKHHVPKVYEARCKHPLTAAMVEQLLAGVELREPEGKPPAKFQRPPETTRAEGAELAGETLLRLTLVEGKYHQVKRMVAAVGNRVEALHRSQFGALTLPADLAPGQWRWVEPGDITPG
ncbi:MULTISPECIES: 16S rRNA pseudouridine(516) synthase [unclassified Roseateles]|uniref:16S rRNA pseudouridine(516) synthase n=1 Tax=unclassified Roseateles TaxID=2626991 RepID=UPI0006F4964F|nr:MULTISPECIES: 16S rRNA pseudouridine(516) synthase [unclassified Roseateles]KQW43466.1 16S rRNA pseudouridine(516) synthase [Pelomonas sp. Root405]KRA71204.1 16S rRNA pseudouridine(516) synthase [Pelomonas sp. Root662]